VDPPYGGRPAIDPKSSRFVYRAERGDYIEFENVPPPASYFDELRRVSKRQIIWESIILATPTSQVLGVLFGIRAANVLDKGK
jgi:hypothetical protein